MKKLFCIIIPSIALVFSSCITGQGNPGAIAAGSAIGGLTGSLIGGRLGGWPGSHFGALLGTVAGAAVADAATSPKEDNYREYTNTYERRDPDYHYRDDYRNPESHISLHDVRFEDVNGNMAIDSKETCQLSFVIVNNSREPAYDVTPVIDIYGSKEILVSRSVSISYMSPGQKVRYTATVKGKKGLRDGEVEVNIYATDSSGAVSDGLRFTMPTYRKW